MEELLDRVLEDVGPAEGEDDIAVLGVRFGAQPPLG